jgi:hypothetical protein
MASCREPGCRSGAGGELEDARLPPLAVSCRACSVVMAASQSIPAIGVVPSVMLVPVCTKPTKCAGAGRRPGARQAAASLDRC